MSSGKKVPAQGPTERMNDADVVAAVLAKFRTTPHGLNATGDVWDEYQEACEPEVIARILSVLSATRAELAAAVEREKVAQAEAAHWQQRWTALRRLHLAVPVGLDPSRTHVANGDPVDTGAGQATTG